MGSQHGTTGDSLEVYLKKNGVSFEFFQAVRLLEQILKPEAQVGRQGPASREIIRFRPSISLAFPSSDISAIESIPDESTGLNRFRIETTFLGLYGITSPLPTFYTEDIIWKDQEESAVRAFLDLFHHRFISLFYRCWAKYRHDIQFKEGGKDEYSSRLFGLIGLGTPGLKESSGLSPVRMLRYAGLLTQRPLSASSLEGVISDYFNDLPVTIFQNTGRWTSIRSQDQVSLNRQNCRLGIDTTLGEKIFSRSGSFLVSMGPMTLEDFMTFLPIGENFSVLVAIVKFMLQDPLEFEIELCVKLKGIPQLQLQPSNESRLGWTTWLSSEPLNGDSVRSLRLNPASMMEMAMA